MPSLYHIPYEIDVRGKLNNCESLPIKNYRKTIMGDQLTSAFESLMIKNQPEAKNEIVERLGIKENFVNNEINIIRSPSSQGCREKQKNVFGDLQKTSDKIIKDENISENNKRLEFDTVDHKSVDKCEITPLVKRSFSKSKSMSSLRKQPVRMACMKTPINYNSSFKKEPVRRQIPNETSYMKTPVQNNSSIKKESVRRPILSQTSDIKTPVQDNASFKKEPVRSSPRLNSNKEDERALTNDKNIDDQMSEPVSTPLPPVTPYHTPRIDKDETTMRNYNDKSIWSTPQIKSRHQKRRINIKATPEVISENVPDIATSTPFKHREALPESPGLENIYPKVISPTVNEQLYSSIPSGYSSSEDVLSTENSVCSTPSISKANVSFGIAKVYCFDRCFGIDTVPEEGDFALGMSQVAWEAIDCPIYDNSEALSKSMQKLTIDQRRTLLEESLGSIESSKVEDDDDVDSRSPEIEVIRSAREQVGCRCIGACDPATCECAQSEIECHVERAGWPCGCTKQRCKNPEGRRHYQPAKIKKETRIKIMQTLGEKGKIRRSV